MLRRYNWPQASLLRATLDRYFENAKEALLEKTQMSECATDLLQMFYRITFKV